VNGKPIFFIYQPSNISYKTINLWRSLAQESGLAGLHLVGIIKNTQEGQVIQDSGFDACTISRTNGRGTKLPWLQTILVNFFGRKQAENLFYQVCKKPFHIYESKDLLPYIDVDGDLGLPFYPCVIPNWDNTPRAGMQGQVFKNPSPDIFVDHLNKAYQRVMGNPIEQQIIVIKSWNEWAEGNYLEPDQRFGHGFLEGMHDFLSGYE